MDLVFAWTSVSCPLRTKNRTSRLRGWDEGGVFLAGRCHHQLRNYTVSIPNLHHAPAAGAHLRLLPRQLHEHGVVEELVDGHVLAKALPAPGLDLHAETQKNERNVKH